MSKHRVYHSLLDTKAGEVDHGARARRALEDGGNAAWTVRKVAAGELAVSDTRWDETCSGLSRSVARSAVAAVDGVATAAATSRPTSPHHPSTGGNAPPTSPRNSAPLGVADSPESHLILVGFGGLHPEFDEEATRWRKTVANIDTCHDSVDGDWGRPEVHNFWRDEAREGRVFAGRFEVPCKTFSCSGLNDEAPPGVEAIPQLRSRRALPGLPPTPPAYQGLVDLHELFVDVACDIFEALITRKRRCILEGPTDRGNEALGPRVYRKKFADHAPLELHPRVVRLTTEFGAVVIRCFQCAAGGKFQKATTFICDPASAAALQPLARLPCVHAAHEKVAHGLDPISGQALSHEARIFPYTLAVVLAIVLAGGGPREVRAQLAPVFTQVFRKAAAAANLHPEAQVFSGSAAARAFAMGGEPK